MPDAVREMLWEDAMNIMNDFRSYPPTYISMAALAGLLPQQNENSGKKSKKTRMALAAAREMFPEKL